MKRAADRAEDTSRWPAATRERIPWRPRARASSRLDRLFREYEAAVPPHIATRVPHLGPRAVTALSDATAAIATLDAYAAPDAGPLWTQLLRSESVASSKIERIFTKQADLAAALAGAPASQAARDVAAHVTAIETLVRVAAKRQLELGHILAAHHALLSGNLLEAAYAGRLRDVQNWIGGSDESPRDADFVPPAPSRVEPLMRDLMRFVARDDIPAIAHAAIAHAQFETIHPFTDGNGRIGRALVHAMMRRRGLTKRTMVPIAAGLLAAPEQYFAALTAYRLEGDVDGFVEVFSLSATIAASESLVALRELYALPERWFSDVRPRQGSVVEGLIHVLIGRPVLGVDDVMAIAGTTARGAYDAIAKLQDHGVLREMTQRKRNRLWSAPDVFSIVDDLERRIGKRRKVERRNKGNPRRPSTKR